MKKCERMVALLPILLYCVACCGLGCNVAQPASGASTISDDASGFISGTWFFKDFLDEVKKEGFSKTWGDVESYTGFTTYIDREGSPYWAATFPDAAGKLTKAGNGWNFGNEPLLEFFTEDGDTFAKYYAKDLVFTTKSTLEHPRIYQKVPFEKIALSDSVRFHYVREDYAYKFLCFQGEYRMSASNGENFPLTLLSNEIVQCKCPFKEYYLNLVNDQPILMFQRMDDEFESFVVDEVENGFILFEMLNEEPLEGDGNEILKGNKVYELHRLN